MPVRHKRIPNSDRPHAVEIEEIICGAINRGELSPGERLGSTRQLARQLKTTYSAVRQSLETLATKGIVVRRSRAGTFVSSGLADRPDENQILTTEGRPQQIMGLLVPDIRLPEYGLLTHHIQNAAREAHCGLLIGSTDNDPQRCDESVRRYLEAGVAGLIIVSPQTGKISIETLLSIKKSDVPVVTYARSVNFMNWTTVQTDMSRGIYLPAQHLCKLGRRQLGFIAYPDSNAVSAQTRAGLYWAMVEAGLTADNLSSLSIPEDIYLDGWADNHKLCGILDDWLREHPKIDAVCCAHDHLAAAVLRVLREKGVRVPDDVAVTGFTNMSQYFGLSAGDLTSVDTDLPRVASEMLRVLDKPRDANESLIIIDPKLVIGRSTVLDAGT